MTRRALVLFIVLGAAASTAAQTDLEAARAHYKAGAAYYARGKYQAAIREFEQSYELSRKPEILYNLAQCHDKLGQRERVVEYLQRYLKEKPRAEDREQIGAWLRHLEQAVAAERAAADKAAERTAAARAAAARAAADQAAAERAAAEARAAATQAAAAHSAAERDARERAAAERAEAERAARQRAEAELRARPQRPEDERAGRGLAILGDVGVGAGIVMLLGGVTVAVLAKFTADDLTDKLDVSKHPDAAFTPELQSAYANGPTYANTAIGLTVAGSVLIVAGAITLYYGKRARRPAESRVTLAPRVAPGGALVGWSF